MFLRHLLNQYHELKQGRRTLTMWRRAGMYKETKTSEK